MGTSTSSALADAYLSWFDPEAVTVKGYSADRTVAWSQSVAIAKRLRASQNELQAAGLAIDSTGIWFRLPVALLGGNKPLPTHVVEDAEGMDYLIHTSELRSDWSHYSVLCTEVT